MSINKGEHEKYAHSYNEKTRSKNKTISRNDQQKIQNQQTQNQQYNRQN
jgi:hypothetical protein